MSEPRGSGRLLLATATPHPLTPILVSLDPRRPLRRLGALVALRLTDDAEIGGLVGDHLADRLDLMREGDHLSHELSGRKVAHDETKFPMLGIEMPHEDFIAHELDPAIELNPKPLRSEKLVGIELHELLETRGRHADLMPEVRGAPLVDHGPPVLLGVREVLGPRIETEAEDFQGLELRHPPRQAVLDGDEDAEELDHELLDTGTHKAPLPKGGRPETEEVKKHLLTVYHI